MSAVADTTSDWYVLGAHTRRAIGYLGAALAERGDLPEDFEQPVLLELWGEALGETMEPEAERSPIHAAEASETQCEWYQRQGCWCEPREEPGKGSCPW